MSEWAYHQGFAVSMHGSGTMMVDGKLSGNRPWRMELGKPTRNYIRGEELRGRAELGLPEDIAVLLMNRPLKEALERKAYSMITDTLQTTADPNLPEEMRWLAMYSEVGWDTIPQLFWERFAVLADRREHALAWLDPQLAQMMLDWPSPAPSPEVPFLLIMLRGKAYMRMEYSPADVATLQYAAQIFTAACESAVGGLSAFKLPA
ncbi:MAG TPA: hypothetical protein VHA82_08175 [Ramlibacter sp.]|uniref:hypothetical protein n=1 Tax=Ramlibacter sp. TaxID=1917967 RepID=UPI002C6BD1EE|nr:hypothetical protein [Ramlibacter sp.]HVZ43772.1 hypothetical protein [Ramlibacter sp.]